MHCLRVAVVCAILAVVCSIELEKHHHLRVSDIKQRSLSDADKRRSSIHHSARASKARKTALPEVSDKSDDLEDKRWSYTDIDIPDDMAEKRNAFAMMRKLKNKHKGQFSFINNRPQKKDGGHEDTGGEGSKPADQEEKSEEVGHDGRSPGELEKKEPRFEEERSQEIHVKQPVHEVERSGMEEPIHEVERSKEVLEKKPIHEAERSHEELQGMQKETISKKNALAMMKSLKHRPRGLTRVSSYTGKSKKNALAMMKSRQNKHRARYSYLKHHDYQKKNAMAMMRSRQNKHRGRFSYFKGHN